MREIRAASLEEYTAEGNQDLRDAVERKFEKLAEAVIDTSEQMIKQEDRTVPRNRKGTVTAIEDLGIVEPELADRLREAIGFRDVLAHTYGPIVNDELVRDALQHSLDRYVVFVEAVSEYIPSSRSD